MLLRCWWLFLFLTGCSLSFAVPTTTPIPETVDADGWEQVAPGIEQRLFSSESNLPLLQAVRLDPALVTFRAHYRAGEPLALAGWQDALPDAQVILNANFFTPENTVLGILISDGVVHGTPYRDRGGAFILENGLPRIVDNRQEPYVGQVWQQAVQAFPMLVRDGAAAYTNSNDRQISRRSLVAIDSQGRVLLMATPGLGMRLADLSELLVQLDADIQNAVNLDGGGSTMMSIAPADYRLLSFDPVPAVLVVSGR